MRTGAAILRLAAIGLCVLPGTLRSEGEPKVPVTYEGDVKPILRKHCVACHNSEKPRGDLDLTSLEGITAGGVSGKAVVAGNSEGSVLFALTAHLDDPKMPPNKPKIPQREIETIQKWIDGGLVEKIGAAPAAVPGSVPGPAADGLSAVVAFARPTPLTTLAVSPRAPLAALPGNKQVLLFELPSGKPVGGLAFPEGEIHVLKFSRDGKILIAGGGIGGQSGVVVGFEVGSWKRRFALGEETDAVLAADISPDNSHVALGGPGRVVKVFSVSSGTVVHTLRKATDWVTTIAFSPEGLLLAAGDRFGGLHVWEAKSGKEFWTLRGHTKGITGIAWRADSDRLASASEDCTVRLWDMHTGAEISHWDAHEEGVTDVVFHTHGQLLTSGRDGRVRVWEQTGRLTGEIGKATDMVTRVAWAHDGKSVLSVDWSGEAKAWSAMGAAPLNLAIPIRPRSGTTVSVPVPAPAYPALAAQPIQKSSTATNAAATPADLERKRAALKAIEDAVEKLKEEAARDPKNAALAKAYLQLCEAALAMKAEVLAAEHSSRP